MREEDVPPPTGPTPEIRAQALWSALECETPLEHWTVGLEAFAVALDDPDEAWRSERGDRIGLGFDLEWEAAAAPEAADHAFSQHCTVHGDLLVGRDERLDITARGWRYRSWTRVDPPSPPGRGSLRHRAPLMLGDQQVLYELRADGWASAAAA